MSKVFVNIALSLDGYMAPAGMDLQHWGDPQHLQWGAKWGALMGWVLSLQAFREKLKFGPGGDTGPVNDAFRHTMERSGANIMGQRMFEQGEVSWPEEAPFHTPVFVLTHNKREPWVRPGGTTFYFVNDGPERALELARAAAGGRDVRISGGANVIQQYLTLGVVEELEIAHTAVLFGAGRRLFEGVAPTSANFVVDSVLAGPGATHVRYRRA
jgi:dihydrofolate reductase